VCTSRNNRNQRLDCSSIVKIVRQIERMPTASGDVPLSPCVIVNSGQLALDDPFLNEQATASDGDNYEDFPDDENSLDIGKPENALQVCMSPIVCCNLDTDR
jgi:hypothetical protein